ncbi:MAG: RluA family pseudouridine synthase [Streptobacillus sp.]
MKEIIIDKNSFRMKVSQYLREFHNYSGRSLRNIEVYFNGNKVKTTFKLPQEGILIVKEKEKSTDLEAKYLNLDIIYEDDDLLIINKPPFLLTHPTLKKVDITLANGIVYYFNDKYKKKLVPRFVNRLDMNTSGLIVIAKNAFTQNFFQSENANIEKKYLAIAEGIIEDDHFIIEKNIYKDGDRLDRIIDERGQYAKTEFKVIERFKNIGVTLVECKLYTGRTHQIRVHLKSINHPIIGDSLYNPESKYNKIVNRQMLHSYFLEFNHPTIGKRLKFDIGLYKDMKDLIY